MFLFCSKTIVIYFKLFNFSTSPSSILGCFAPSIFIGAFIIFSRSGTPTCDRHNACNMPISSWPSGAGEGVAWGCRGRGLASTTHRG